MGRVKQVSGQASCEVCGNHHNQCFEIRLGGERHIFDSFECAMRAFRLWCEHCGCQIIGHGVQLGNTIYCSYECANEDSTLEYEMRVLLREQTHL